AYAHADYETSRALPASRYVRCHFPYRGSAPHAVVVPTALEQNYGDRTCCYSLLSYSHEGEDMFKIGGNCLRVAEIDIQFRANKNRRWLIHPAAVEVNEKALSRFQQRAGGTINPRPM